MEDDKAFPLGQQLIVDLVKALAANTAMQAELVTQLKNAQELLRETFSVMDDVAGTLVTGLRIVDHVSEVARDRNPGWHDVAEVMEEIQKENTPVDDDGNVIDEED